METTQQKSTPEEDSNMGESPPKPQENPTTDEQSGEFSAASENSHQTPENQCNDPEKEDDNGETDRDGHATTGSGVKEQIDSTSKQLMDYIAQLESRIERLETMKAVPITKRKDTGATGSQTKICKFFVEADEPPFHFSNKPLDNRWKIHGSFRSEVDAPSLIRVLYTWIEPRSEDERGTPSPEDIDILELRITSKPVTDFLGQKLEFDFSQDGVLHVTKPFRILIRNFHSIKEESDRLLKQQ